MYAAHKTREPIRPTSITTTTSSSNDDFFDSAAIYNNLPSPWSYFVAGTLGLLTLNCLLDKESTANWSISKNQINEQSKAPPSAIGSSVRDIAHIRGITKISITELANVFGVSRQAVYEWMKGSALSPLNAQRLSMLAQATDVLFESGIDVTPQALRRKIAGDLSILDAVRENKNVVELAKTLVATLVRESQQRQLLAARLAGQPRPDFSDIEFGLLHLNEN